MSEGSVVHETGAVRSGDADTVRFDLISPLAMEELAKTYHEGALKYSPNNWRKGFRFSVLMNHALRHLFLYLRGDRSEPHLAHAVWNVMSLIHLEKEGRVDLDDIYDSPSNADSRPA